jgi:hypothetical protein
MSPEPKQQFLRLDRDLTTAPYPALPRSKTGQFVHDLGKFSVAVPAQGEHSAESRAYQAYGQ